MAADDEVRWISLGLGCLTDGVLGVYSDWKIDYVPTAHLLADASATEVVRQDAQG
jgi:hypothetical protein